MARFIMVLMNMTPLGVDRPFDLGLSAGTGTNQAWLLHSVDPNAFIHATPRMNCRRAALLGTFGGIHDHNTQRK
jgi:hypothetical protein